MNVIARLEYELAYYDSAVHHFNHYTTRTPPILACVLFNNSTSAKMWYNNGDNSLNSLSDKKIWKAYKVLINWLIDWFDIVIVTFLHDNSSSFINTNPILLSLRLSPSSQTCQFGRTVLSAVLTLLFCIYVLFIQYTCSTYFLLFRFFFLAPNRPQQI